MNPRKLLVGMLVMVVSVIGVYLAFFRNVDRGTAHGASGERNGETKAVVRTVHPRLDPSFRITNQQIATVEPFYQAALRARAAGVVRSVRKEIGESVRMGELLVEIDAPELEQDVEQKEAVIRQRQQELRVSLAQLKHATAAIETAEVAVSQRSAEARQAEATRDYKKKYLTRLQGLLRENAIRPEIVDESEKDYLAAHAAYEAAQVAIQKAKADKTEKQAMLEAAQADNKLKAALVEVAEKDRDRAAVAAGFARIRAPFDGVIVRRNVDPGMFVQNATTGTSETLITVARVDLVTVSMKLPDVAAPFVSRNTEVEVTFDDLPGIVVRGRVTRFSPAIDGSDRTMRVELDVFNGTHKDFQAFMACAVAETVAPFAGTSGLSMLATTLAADRHRQLFHKGVSDGTAVCLDVPAGAGVRPLVPGMMASMRVFLDGVSAAHLLPSGAVYSAGGKTYILIVRDGLTKQIPVRVQVNDGRMSKVALLAASATGIHELSGNEEVVMSRQLEIGDNAKVRTVVGDW